MSESRPVPLYKNVWLWAFLGGIVCLTLMRPLLRREPAAPLPVGQLPAFELVASDGRRFGLRALEGRAWVVGLAPVTGSSSACGGLIGSMAELDRRYEAAGVARVGLITISVEPGQDTPERLQEFGRARGIDPGRWMLVGGEADEVRRLAEILGATAEARVRPVVSSAGVSHGCELFLLDGGGGIRGAYRDDIRGLDEIFHRSQHVLRAMG